MRFVKRTTITKDGEIAAKTVYGLDQEQIEKEAMYDGFYAVVTNLEGDVGDIIRINQQRWEIEENFRIMKDETRLPSRICPPKKIGSKPIS